VVAATSTVAPDDSASAAGAEARKKTREQEARASWDAFKRAARVCAPLLVAATAALLAYALQQPPRAETLAGGLIVATAALGAGAFLGFLFGLPRIRRPTEDVRDRGRPVWSNANLEEISDWLTKILVGVGLTQLVRAPAGLDALSDALAPMFGDRSSGGPFGVAISLAFVVSGFLVGYMATRTWVPVAFFGTEEYLADYLERVEQLTDRATQAARDARREGQAGVTQTLQDVRNSLPPGELREQVAEAIQTMAATVDGPRPDPDALRAEWQAGHHEVVLGKVRAYPDPSLFDIVFEGLAGTSVEIVRASIDASAALAPELGDDQKRQLADRIKAQGQQGGVLRGHDGARCTAALDALRR
jgi:hypothetical protein